MSLDTWHSGPGVALWADKRHSLYPVSPSWAPLTCQPHNINSPENKKTTQKNRNKQSIGLMHNMFLINQCDSVDGRNPPPVEVGRLSHYLQGFIHPRWLAGFLPVVSHWCCCFSTTLFCWKEVFYLRCRPLLHDEFLDHCHLLVARARGCQSCVALGFPRCLERNCNC